ncbi:hypothetical protein EIN_116440 [Entamoeba invadens IP1]|uniref:Lysozyme n=1 Tax=Entamoeba invadens IP1 TaxID=370355 RepID=L7FP59_ENTIV|nr:hypothetical protein EIN_116440 [Entamoeba invadens IP1]ELP94533.1 hypothetical protein EIN_116440 [Entamoeba invadens IP1]|eukprot:XP_004261304.1 hypothetical protein EIN_116440 [Entamoeba invadens IP1]
MTKATYYGTESNQEDASIYACLRANGMSDFVILDVFTYNNQINKNFYKCAANAYAAGYTKSQFDLFFHVGPLIGTFVDCVNQMNDIINTNNVEFNIMWLDIDGVGWYNLPDMNDDCLKHELDLLFKYYPKVGVAVNKEFWEKTFTSNLTYSRSNDILLWNVAYSVKPFQKFGWWTEPDMVYNTGNHICRYYQHVYARNRIL